MKRNTPYHPKTGMLAAMLGVKRYQAVGILEMLWHFTAQYCPAGDIGKRTNKQICSFLDYPIKKSDDLIKALIETGWIDEDHKNRLVIHDWHQHSDYTCDKFMKDNKLQYATGHAPRSKNKEEVATSSNLYEEVATSSASRARVPESESESESDSPPNPQGSESESVECPERFRPAFEALRATGKIPNLTPLLVAEVDKFHPDTPLSEHFEVVALELKHITGVVGNPLRWLVDSIRKNVDQKKIRPRREETFGGENCV